MTRDMYMTKKMNIVYVCPDPDIPHPDDGTIMVHTHAYTHIHTHTHTHARTHAHKYTHMRADAILFILTFNCN